MSRIVESAQVREGLVRRTRTDGRGRVQAACQSDSVAPPGGATVQHVSVSFHDCGQATSIDLTHEAFTTEWAREERARTWRRFLDVLPAEVESPPARAPESDGGRA
jgi:hypothetical protein